MFFGVFEIFIILAVIGFIALFLIGGIAAVIGLTRSENGSAGVKVLATVLGVPILISLGAFGYFFQARQAVHQHAVAVEAEHQALKAAEQARQAEEMRRVLKSDENLIPDEAIKSEIESPPLPAVPETVQEASSIIDDTAETAIASRVPAEAPSAIHQYVEVVPSHRISLPVDSFAVIPILLIGALVLTAIVFAWRKHAALGLAFVGGVVLVGALVGVSKPSTVHYATPSSVTVAPSAFDHLPISSPVIAEVATAADSPQWTDIWKVDYQRPNLEKRTELTELPDWVKTSDTSAEVLPSQNEIILHSKRYATVQEAEAELRPIAAAMVHDYLAQRQSELRHASLSQDLILSSGALKEAVQVTYPLEGFEESVRQVHWKLNVDHDVQRTIQLAWQESELFRRLAYLGGGVGFLTLLSGVGAVLARKRETAPVA